MPFNHSLFILTLKVHSDVIPSFLCHSIISRSFRLYTTYYSYVIPSFLAHSDIFPSFRCHSTIQMSFQHLGLILPITGYADNIPSFWCHSIHSMIIRAWNDTEWHFGGMTGMGLEWCFKSFKVHSHHSCHSKKVGFPWFHSCHSGLILSFRGHSKIQFQLEWCWNDEWFWAEVDYFPFSYHQFEISSINSSKNKK